MKRLALLLVLASALSAHASDEAAVVSSTDPETILELLRQGKLRPALERVAAGREGLEQRTRDPGPRRLGLIWAVVRASCFSLDRREDEASVRRTLDLARERVRPEDLSLLRELGASSDRARPYALALARDAGAKIDATSDRRSLIAFLKGDDDNAKRRAIAALGQRLGRIRAKVDSGGDLDAVEQAELADPAVIDALVDELANRQAAADVLAHDLAASATPSPLHALALIEAPAIPALESGRRRGQVGAEEALAAVRDAAQERLRHHPRSTWSSARGAMPQVVPDAVPCTACRKPLPESARFCPSCGANAPGVACPRCGQTTLGEICPRCGGIASVKGVVRACEKCAETIGEGDRFCRRCGLSFGRGVAPSPVDARARELPSVEVPAVK